MLKRDDVTYINANAYFAYGVYRLEGCSNGSACRDCANKRRCKRFWDLFCVEPSRIRFKDWYGHFSRLERT